MKHVLKSKGPIILLAALSFACGNKVDFQQMPLADKANSCATGPCAIDNTANATPTPPGPGPTPSGVVQNSYFFVKRAADILFVIDSSGSMSEEQALLSNAFPEFITKLNYYGGGTLEWRVAITTTDVDSTGPGKKGDLFEFKDLPAGTFYLDNTIPEVSANPSFQKTVIVPGGSGNERGIAGARMTMENEFNASKTHSFIRKDTPLAVIVLSDEDENSNGSGLLPIDLPVNFVPAIHALDTVSALQKSIKFHSIVANNQLCVDGIGQYLGQTYMDLSTLTSGYIGNICDGAYQNQLDFLAQSIVNEANTYTMPCNNVLDGSAKAYVQATAGTLDLVPSTFIAPNKLVLQNPPAFGSIVKTKFNCLD